MLNIFPKVTQVGVEPILLPSDNDAYQHYAFIVVLLLLNFMEQTFIPDLDWVLLNPGSHVNFTRVLWLTLFLQPHVLHGAVILS